MERNRRRGGSGDENWRMGSQVQLVRRGAGAASDERCATLLLHCQNARELRVEVRRLLTHEGRGGRESGGSSGDGMGEGQMQRGTRAGGVLRRDAPKLLARRRPSECLRATVCAGPFLRHRDGIRKGDAVGRGCDTNRSSTTVSGGPAAECAAQCSVGLGCATPTERSASPMTSTGADSHGTELSIEVGAARHGAGHTRSGCARREGECSGRCAVAECRLRVASVACVHTRRM